MGDKNMFLFAFASLFLSIAYAMYSTLFFMRVLYLSSSLGWRSPILPTYPSLLWTFTSLFITIGYFLLAVVFTKQMQKKIPFEAFILPLVPLVFFEMVGLSLACYLFFLAILNLKQSKGTYGILGLVTYFILGLAQVSIVWGVLSHSYLLYLLGLGLRGLTFLPSLLVFIWRKGGRARW
ncbi:MAG: hypothetical protein GWO20_05020 [Candidatus Korarchaeota archaeon]|nr:hypothetical protein [Candidatus Korarchaeota archaeon]NIU82799.1 hypothetical protein [Candidatus Thorarchaeota archaeon]NIW13292.1 hypothetical protein [Candidatus Thorarchaeota archaeon]NIW52148.1 hypothetical protein [Candidatus Korarchaeota archaeon]